MPPKKQSDKPSKKNVEKAKTKNIEDKTFGLKNKKGNKNQKYIAQVEHQIKSGGDPLQKKKEAERAAEKKKKEAALKLEEEQKALFRPVMTQKVASGVDPKSVFCAFFKQGLCKKTAEKCKFSHDPDIEHKSAKRSIYTDTAKDEDDDMEDWDEEKLADVVGKKHGAEKKLETAIICKFFLDALENNKYGWFWNCPEEAKSGKQCKYRHALPPGFVLKKDKKKSDLMNESDKVSIEELIEQKRIELNAQSKALTPVNLQTFVAWKKRKLREKAEAEAKNNEDKKKKMKSGVHVGMSGRDMFLFDENMGSNENDDGEDKGEAFDLSKLDKEDSDEAPVKVHEIKFDEYGIMDDGLEATTNEQLKNLKGEVATDLPKSADSESDDSADDFELLEGAEGGATAVIDEAAFDEDLFEDEDLDDLEDELNNLEV